MSILEQKENEIIELNGELETARKSSQLDEVKLEELQCTFDSEMVQTYRFISSFLCFFDFKK